MGNKRYVSTGTSALEVLFIVMVVLKLLDLTTISWFWVLSPIWIPIAIVIVIASGMGIYAVGKYLIKKRKN